MISPKPMIPFTGVLISWEMLFMKAVFSLLLASALIWASTRDCSMVIFSCKLASIPVKILSDEMSESHHILFTLIASNPTNPKQFFWEIIGIVIIDLTSEELIKR